MRLHVTLASFESSDDTNAGRILPPHMEIEYSTIGEKNTIVPITFEIVYHANISQVDN